MVLGVASSGVHSNGFSLVRRIVEASGLQYSDRCPYDASKTLGAGSSDSVVSGGLSMVSSFPQARRCWRPRLFTCGS